MVIARTHEIRIRNFLSDDVQCWKPILKNVPVPTVFNQRSMSSQSDFPRITYDN